MGVKCQIVRDSQDRVISVEAPNGNESRLFSKLLDITKDERKALDLWAFSYSKEFNEIENTARLDSNGEHRPEVVLGHVGNQISEKGLSKEDAVELVNSFGHLPFTSVEQLYKALSSSLMSNGIFSLNKDRLLKSGLFTEQEASNILSNKQLSNNLVNLLADLKREMEKSFQDASLQSILNNKNSETYSFTTNEVTKFGKTKRLNAGEVMDKIALELVGIEDKNTFTEKLLSLPYTNFVTDIVNNPDKLDRLFADMKSKMAIPFMYIGPDGTLQQKTSPGTFNNLVNSILTGADNHFISANVELLSNISKETWDENEKEIKVILRNIAKDASAIGIDIYDLEKMYDNKPYGDIIDFLNSLVGFTSDLEFSTASVDDVRRFSNIYNEFFSIQETELNQVFEKKDANLIYLPENIDELTAFTQLGLVKVSEGVYQKIERESNYVDTLYEMFMEDRKVLPKSAVKSALDRNGNIVESKLADIAAVKQDISNFIKARAKNLQIYNQEKQKDVEELVAFKTAFGYSISDSPAVEINKEFNRMSTEGIKMDYLTGEFLREFAKEKAEQRYKNSPLYNNVLRHFEIDNSGIRLINTDENTKATIRFMTPDKGVYANLKKYAAVSKSSDLSSLFEYAENRFTPGTPFLRNLYVNNPNLLERYTGKISTIDGKVHLPNMTNNFVRIGNHILERIGEYGNMGVYGVLNSVTDPNFNLINKNMSPGTFNGAPTNELVRGSSQPSTLKISKLATQKELDSIKEDIDGCN